MGRSSTNSQKQHVDMHRKVMLRRELLPLAADGAVYVPFCGDGDIATEVYGNRVVYAADIDKARVAVCRKRVKGTVKTADCDRWPFSDVADPFSVGDFDAYSYPYDSFRAFWQHATKALPVAVFFTDGQPQNILRKRTGQLYHPKDKSELRFETTNERREAYNFYWDRVLLPWLSEYVAPLLVTKTLKYKRGAQMIYWGAVIGGTVTEDSLSTQKVERALYEAAISGNVPACVAWLERRAPERWASDRKAAAIKKVRRRNL